MRENFSNFDFNFHGFGFEIAKIYQEIYSKRKGENSQGGFRFEGTRKVNSRALSEIFNKKEIRFSWRKNLKSLL